MEDDTRFIEVDGGAAVGADQEDLTFVRVKLPTALAAVGELGD
jgi:hypothetical protein